MDDPYESSYGTSLDSEPCVSPSTKERYTFNRSSSNHTSRLSDHFHRSRQDSVAEEDEMIDDENARLGPPGSFEDDGLLFRSDSINNPSTSTLTESQQSYYHHHPEKSKFIPGSLFSSTFKDQRNDSSSHLAQKIKTLVVTDGLPIFDQLVQPLKPCHQKHSLLDVFEPKYHKRKESTLFKPLLDQLKEYHESQDYWFDFSTTPIRFPLSTKAKGGHSSKSTN